MDRIIKVKEGTNRAELLHMPEERKSRLDFLKEHVGGWIEMVQPRRLYAGNRCCGLERQSAAMLVDEDGFAHERQINLLGSVLYETDKHGQPIVGDILIVGLQFNRASGGYEICGLTDLQIQKLQKYMDSLGFLKDYREFGLK